MSGSKTMNKFAAAVGRMPFKGRHVLQPVALEGMRSRNLDAKKQAVTRLYMFALSNVIGAATNTAILAYDIHQAIRGDISPLRVGEMAFSVGMIAASSASIVAEIHTARRITVNAREMSYTVGIDVPVEPVSAEPPVSPWPERVERRDTILWCGAWVLAVANAGH